MAGAKRCTIPLMARRKQRRKWKEEWYLEHGDYSGRVLERKLKAQLWKVQDEVEKLARLVDGICATAIAIEQPLTAVVRMPRPPACRVQVSRAFDVDITAGLSVDAPKTEAWIAAWLWNCCLTAYVKGLRGSSRLVWVDLNRGQVRV